jgi:hypothetical protein
MTIFPVLTRSSVDEMMIDEVTTMAARDVDDPPVPVT